MRPASSANGISGWVRKAGRTGTAISRRALTTSASTLPTSCPPRGIACRPCTSRIAASSVSIQPIPITVSYDAPVGAEPTGRDNPELLTTKLSHGHDQTIVNGISRIGYMTGGKTALWKDEDMAIVFTRQAKAFIERHKDERFFLYFATHDPHVPRVPNARFRRPEQAGPAG